MGRCIRFNRGGFTVAEMVVATSILAMFVVLALGTIVPAFKITKEAEESLAAQREVVLAFDRLITELSPLDRASLSTAPDTLSYLSNQQYRGPNSAIPDSDLLPLGIGSRDNTWLKTVILRHRGGQLWRREFPYNHGKQFFQVLPESLPVYGDSANVSEKIFAKNIEYFETVPAGRSRVYLKVRSVFRKADKPVSCELNLQIQMRGGM